MATESATNPPRPLRKDDEERKVSAVPSAAVGDFFQAEDLVRSMKELKDAIAHEAADAQIPRSRRSFHEREEDPIDRLRFELLQKQIENKTAEAVPKPRWNEGYTFAAVLVTGIAIFVSNISLSNKLTAVSTSLDELKQRAQAWDTRLEQNNQALNELRVQNAQTSTQLAAKLDSILDRLQRLESTRR